MEPGSTRVTVTHLEPSPPQSPSHPLTRAERCKTVNPCHSVLDDQQHLPCWELLRNAQSETSPHLQNLHFLTVPEEQGWFSSALSCSFQVG